MKKLSCVTFVVHDIFRLHLGIVIVSMVKSTSVLKTHAGLC